MAELSRRLELITGQERRKEYQHRGFRGREVELERLLATSCIVYVGNLSFYTKEEQIHDLFARVGPVRRIIMGLNRITKSPCGFCFVEYFKREHTDACVRFINGSELDGRVLRVDIDPEFTEDRRYGRGSEGGQIRDEYRPGPGAAASSVGSDDLVSNHSSFEQSSNLGSKRERSPSNTGDEKDLEAKVPRNSEN